MAKSGTCGIAEVATRIQQRALQLSSENATLQLVKAQLEEVTETFEREKNENESLRQNLLRLVQYRNELELEKVIKTKEQISFIQNKINEEQNEYESAVQRMKEMEKEWERLERDVYSKHEVKIELYKRKVEGIFDRREAKKKKRIALLNKLESIASEANKSAAQMHKETASARQKIHQMDIPEEMEDEEISALAMNIRATVAKVSQYVMYS